jgi:EmrB/QacA subfamily drug resistance transporter
MTQTDLTPRQIRVIMAGPLVAMFLAALDQTIVAPALPTIARDLGSFADLSWVITAYLLASTATTPIFGKLSDLYGRRTLLLVSIGIFILGSIACALAPSMLWLVIARAVQGIGGGGLLALPNTIIADVVSPRDRGKYQGYFAAVYAISGLAGPVLGGVLTEHISWTLVFWLNIPLGLGAAYISYRALSHVKGAKRAHQIDYAGSVLMVAATVTFLLALTFGGHRYAWGSMQIVGLFAVAAIFTLLFGWSQTRASEPVLPLSLFKNPIVRLTSFIGFIIVMVNTSISIYVPLWLELTRGFSPDQSGLALISPMLAVVLGAVISGQYMRLTGLYKRPPAIGFSIAAIALAAFAFYGEAMPLAPAIALLGVIGCGLGTGFPALMVATQNAVETRDIGVATGSQAFFRSLGGSVGVAMFGAILVGALSATGDVSAALRDNSDPVALAHGFSRLFAAAAFVTALGAAALMALKEIPLRHHAPQTESKRV